MAQNDRCIRELLLFLNRSIIIDLMKPQWEIQKKDFKQALLREVKDCKEDKKLAEKTITYLMSFLPLNYNPGKKLEIVPTLAGLSLYTGVEKEILEAKGKSGVFKKLFSYLYAIQEARVLALSLKGRINYKIASLVLYNHGYKTRKENKEVSLPENGVELAIKFEGAEYQPIKIEKKREKSFNELLEDQLKEISRLKPEAIEETKKAEKAEETQKAQKAELSEMAEMAEMNE